MKIVTKYICEVCGDRYDTPEEGERCEAQPDPLKCSPPVGTIFGDAYGESHHDRDMTFAVARYDRIGRSHGYDVALWAARDTGNGDSLVMPPEVGGAHGVYPSAPFDRDPPAPEHPTFKRMVKFLKRQKVPIYCATGPGTWLPLEEFLAEKKLWSRALVSVGPAGEPPR